jgi:diguanylate cyclase (GGDEF)-like protein
MMPETDLADAVAFAEKIRDMVASTPMRTQAGELTITASIGVAAVPHSRLHSAKELIIAADKALYRAKRSGRNQVQEEKRRDLTRKRSSAAAASAAEPRTARQA